MRAKKCRHCGGPMPPPAPTGRPALYCSVACRRWNEYAVAERRWAEQARRDRPRREAEWRAVLKARDAEAKRLAEEKRQRNLAAGGETRLDQLQRDAFENNRCGWYEDGDTEVCIRPTDESHIWCKRHNRQLEREAKERRRARAGLPR